MKTDEAVAGLLTKGAEKLGEYTDALATLTKQYAPDVVNAGLTVIKLEAAQKFLEAGVAMVVFLLAIYPAIRLIRLGIETAREYAKPDVPYTAPDGFAPTVAGALLLVIPGISVIVLSGPLFSIWTYVMLTDPKLYIAYKIMGKFL